MTTLLDLSAVPVAAEDALVVHRRIQRLLSLWTERPDFDLRVTHVRRVYAPENRLSAALRLGRLAGWRQGGNGEADGLASFINNDARAFCMEAPERSALALCSNNPALSEMLADLKDAGVDVYLISLRSWLGGHLAGLVERNNIGILY